MPVYNKQLTRLDFNRNFQVGSSIWNASESYTDNTLATRLWIRENNGLFVDFSEYNTSAPTHTGATFKSTKGPNWRFPIQGLRPEYASATVPTQILLDDIRNFYPGYDQESSHETIFSGWIKLDEYNAGSGSSGSAILEISSATNKSEIIEARSLLTVFVDSSGDLAIRFATSSTEWVKVTAPNHPLPINAWFNFVIVVPDTTSTSGQGTISQADLANTKIYIDGQYTGAVTVANKGGGSVNLNVPAAGTHYAYIGYGMGEDDTSSMEGPVDFDGEIAELAIHKHSGFDSYTAIDIRKIFYRGAVQGVNQLSSGVTNINPFVRRSEDQNRDYNPTILSGMDSRRRGNAASTFDDTQVPQVSGSTLSYPTKLFTSDPLLNTIYSNPFVNLDIEVPTTRSFNSVADFKIYEDYFDRDEQPALDPFVDSRLYSPGTGSKGDFFTTGSLNLAGAVSSSFSKPLTEKTAIVIDLNPSTPSTFGFTDPMEQTYTSPSSYAGGDFNSYGGSAPSSAATGSLMMYWNDTHKRFDTIGEIVSFKEAALVDATTYNTLAKVNDYLEEKTCVGFSRSSAIAAMLLSSSNGGGKVVSRGGTGVYEVPGGDTAQYTGTARPISTFGFPFASKYQAPTDNLVSMNNYIDKPFLLEKIVYRFSGSFQCGTNSGNNTSTYGLGHAIGGITPSNGKSTQSINTRTSIQHYSFFLARQFETIDRGPTTISRDAFRKSGSSLVIDTDSDMAGGLLQHYTASTTTRELLGYGQVFLAFETLNSDYFDQTTFDYLRDNGMGREVSIFVEHENQVTGSYQMEFLPTKTPIYDTSVPVRIPISDAASTDAKDETITFQSFLGGRGLPFDDETRDFAKNIIGQTPAISSVFGSGASNSDDLLEVKVNDVTPVHSPYVLMPEDKLIFGWSAPLELEDGFTGLGSHPNTFTASPGVGEIVFYGSYLQDEKPKPNYLNQSPQFTQAVFRDLGEEIHDQFDLEVLGAFTGSYVDDSVFTGGSRFEITKVDQEREALDPRDRLRTFGQKIRQLGIGQSPDVRDAVYTAPKAISLSLQRDAYEEVGLRYLTRFVNHRATSGVIPRNSSTFGTNFGVNINRFLQRNVTHGFEGEFQFDSILLDVKSIAKVLETVAFKENSVIYMGGPETVSGEIRGMPEWPFMFPFEKKFRHINKTFAPFGNNPPNGHQIYWYSASITSELSRQNNVSDDIQTSLNSSDFIRYCFDDYGNGTPGGAYGALQNANLLFGIGNSNRGRVEVHGKGLTPVPHLFTAKDNMHRGCKFGLANTVPRSPTCVFRRDRFGQLRDMLEQSINTTVVDTGFNVVRQHPVKAKFVDLENPRRPTPPYNTHRGNKDVFSRVSFPFLDQDAPNPDTVYSGTPGVDVLLSPSENLDDYMNLNQKNNTTIVNFDSTEGDDDNAFI